MKTNYAKSHHAALLKYVPETSIATITTMKYTSFNVSYRIKKDLQILSKNSAGYSVEQLFNAGLTLSNLCRINPF